MIIAERTLGVGLFDPALGGDPILYQHLFWIYSHPAVYIMILPAMGVISEIIPVFTRRRIFGYKAIAFSSLAIAFVGYLVWGHHMFTSGMSGPARIIFSILTFFVAIPSAIKIFNWIATLYKGAIDLQPPLLYALGFIFLFLIGGLTGLVNGALATNTHIHDTQFIVGHFHYVMFGGTGFGFFAAMHYWFPKMYGRMYNIKRAKIAFWVSFVGFKEYTKAGLPAISTIYTTKQLKRITFIWTFATVISSLFIPMFGIVDSLSQKIFIGISNLALIILFSKLYMDNQQDFRIKKYFISINIFLLFIMSAIFIDNLI